MNGNKVPHISCVLSCSLCSLRQRKEKNRLQLQFSGLMVFFLQTNVHPGSDVDYNVLEVFAKLHYSVSNVTDTIATTLAYLIVINAQKLLNLKSMAIVHAIISVCEHLTFQYSLFQFHVDISQYSIFKLLEFEYSVKTLIQSEEEKEALLIVKGILPSSIRDRQTNCEPRPESERGNGGQ